MSMALLALAIESEGHAAVSLTGRQCGIDTDDQHTDATILDVRPARVLRELRAGKIVIAAGFQGTSPTGEVTTLGRGMAFGSLFLFVAAAFTEGDRVFQWTPRAVGCLLYLAVAGTVVTFGLYFWVMRHVSATRLSPVAYAMPVVALTLGVLFARESMTWSTLVGFGTIVLGVLGASGPRIALGRRSVSSHSMPPGPWTEQTVAHRA